MTEFPPGRWSYLIIGDQWPTDQDLTALNIGRNNREALESSFTHFVTLLRAAQTGPLSNQRGLTAEDLRNAFRHGEKAVQRVAEKNTIKASAYRMAYDSVLSLQHDLTTIATEARASQVCAFRAVRCGGGVHLRRVRQ
ncbi:hypothetical protein SRL2020226_40380 [Mycobacterium kiyosense]|uniref:Uncharacterized protein n=1 Tax=Mycobacterium kiyosense TaxID=2871094 RepID=A0A9P3Q9A2_9MYCO|nr:hypothetical protein SRL2020028_30780 [Mycobacterium kiyosense]GLB97262.1 hypothetical protein SRL2020226_40380 [Mycobacterium kiyosense]GLD32359.1 hypothetical protein Mkiyose1413_42420 [Mycobacterium kiyosense]GLD37033.1 hypothetical protein Mkiyose1595_32530 [Mycobacterium kiyosense]